MKTEDWLPFVVMAVVVGLMCATPVIAARVEARHRRRERAEDWRRERELWELGRPLRERQRLSADLNRWKVFAHDLGFTPPDVAARIAEISQQLAELRAEQIRKITGGAS